MLGLFGEWLELGVTATTGLEELQVDVVGHVGPSVGLSMPKHIKINSR